MVRLKNRYLLVHILYPDSSQGPNAKVPPSKPDSLIPEVVHFHQPTPDTLTPQLLTRAIREEVSLLFGDYGVGVTASSLSGTVPACSTSNGIYSMLTWHLVKYLSTATSTAIIRCSRAHYRLVWAALSFLTRLPKGSNKYGERPCVFQVVRVSGTIRKAEEEAIRRARATILKAQEAAAEGAQSGLEAILRPAEGRQENLIDVGDHEDKLVDNEDDDNDDDEAESSDKS